MAFSKAIVKFAFPLCLLLVVVSQTPLSYSSTSIPLLVTMDLWSSVSLPRALSSPDPIMPAHFEKRPYGSSFFLSLGLQLVSPSLVSWNYFSYPKHGIHSLDPLVFRKSLILLYGENTNYGKAAVLESEKPFRYSTDVLVGILSLNSVFIHCTNIDLDSQTVVTYVGSSNSQHFSTRGKQYKKKTLMSFNMKAAAAGFYDGKNVCAMRTLKPHASSTAVQSVSWIDC